MKNLRRLLILCLLGLVLVACSGGGEEVPENIEVKIGSLKGPTTIGLAHFIDESIDSQATIIYGPKKNSTGYNFKSEVFPLAEEIVARLNKGELDLALIPANLAATIYNKTDGQIRLLATNNLGVLHLVENGQSLKTKEDLNGKTVYSLGKGTTPDAVLNYFKEKNSLNFDIVYKSEPSEIAKLLASEEGALAFLPEPFVSVVESKNPNVSRFLDMHREWLALNNNFSIVTGVLVARTDLVEERPELIDGFIRDFQRSGEYVAGHEAEILKLAEEMEIIPAGLDESAIKNCNINVQTGRTMEAMLNNYLSILEGINPDLIGGRLPSEDFYYIPKEK